MPLLPSLVIHNINSTANNLKSDLVKTSNWAFQWKMRFNPDPNKQGQEVISSRKINKIDHALLYFIQIIISLQTSRNGIRR